MKKVLIVGYFWPYRPGSRRILGLTKYITEFGWQPVILTAPLYEKPEPQFRVIETPSRDVLSFWKKLLGINPEQDLRGQVKKRFGAASKRSPLIDFVLTRLGEIANYPDSEKGWKPFAIKAGGELLQNEDIDTMISVWPVTSHFIARELKIKYKIPWLADFPDLWSQNHNYSYSSLRKALDIRLERKILAQADALVAVSQPWAEKLRALHEGKPAYTITHGFDPEEVNDPPAELAAKFTITYTGTIYTGKQEPSKLFAALRDLISDEAIDLKEIEVRFYGRKHDWLDKEIEQHGLSSIVKQYGIIPRYTAVEKQRESQLLLLLDWDNSQEKGVYTGKIFEYFGARRPILTTGGVAGNVVDVLLGKTKVGIHAPTVEGIKAALIEFYKEYKLTGKIAYNGLEAEINKYTYREMARKFADILDHLIGK